MDKKASIESAIDKLIKLASNKNLCEHQEAVQLKNLKDEYFKIKASVDNEPITSATKFNVFKRELLATPAEKGYDISHEGKKLFNIVGKDNKPMNKKQLEFCSQIELTRGMKQAKLVQKIASLEAGSTVFIMAHDKASRRVKFASLEHGFRGWAPASKFAFTSKKADPMRHGDHMDDVMGSSKSNYLCECPQGSGNMKWNSGAELLSSNQPPATPESLNDVEGLRQALPPQILNRRNEVNASVLDYVILENAVELYFMDTMDDWDPANPEYANQFDQILNEVKNLDEKQLAAKYPHIYNNYLDGLEFQSEAPDYEAPSNVPSATDTVDAIPTLDKNKKIDQLLEQLSNESDPSKKEKIKQHIERIKRASLIRNAVLNKVARVVHRTDGWHVLSEKGKNLGGPYKSKGEAISRLKQVEYFKHHGAIRPFSRQVIADTMTDLTTHITDMKSRINDVQDKIQSLPPVKTADQVTDETIVTNDPNAVIDPNNPAMPPAPKNVQPTDDDNLNVPVPAPTSPASPGTKWVFDTQFNKYVLMPITDNPGQTI